MAEDLHQPTSNETKMSRSQSTVARVLQDGVVQDSPGRRREEGVTEGGQDEDRPMEVEQHPLQSESRHGEAERSRSPLTVNTNFVSRSNTSPDVYITSPPLPSGLKALKCPMCDYMTTDKSNFRRHKRLHMRNNPTSVLRCGKCDFSTAQPRKIREHYIQDHGEEYGPPLPALPEAVRIQTYGDNHHFGGRHMEIPHNQCGQGTMPMTGTIHTLLGAPPSMQFGRAEPQLLANCVTQYRPYDVQPQGDAQDNQLASDYLRSIVSNIITTHHTPRVPATSTITSSSFYLPPPVESTQTLSPLSHSFNSVQSRADEPQSENVVKVKVEPVDCDGASDVSSSATPVCTSGLRHIAPHPRRLNMDVTPTRGDRNNEATSSGDTAFTNSSEAVGCRPDVRSEPVETSAHRPARDNRPVAEARDSRVMIQSRDSRVLVQSRDSRMMMQSRDARFAVTKQNSQMMVDPRLRVDARDQVVVDQQDLRSIVESRDGGRLTLDIRDLRPQGDLHSGREVRSAVDSSEQRSVVEPGHSRTDLDKREFRTLVPVSAHEHQPLGEVRDMRPSVDIQFTNIPIKTETSTVGIQCSLPVIKTESDASERRARTFLVESSVQCELLSSGRRISSTRFSAECGSGEQPSMRHASKCTHCGVTFEDEVIFSIHIGCHSHTDPFVCNVCGKQCYNKYGFYSHIMRGHRV